VQYNPFSCSYRGALSPQGSADYLRVDCARLQTIAQSLAFDRDPRFIAAPTMESLPSSSPTSRFLMTWCRSGTSRPATARRQVTQPTWLIPAGPARRTAVPPWCSRSTRPSVSAPWTVCDSPRAAQGRRSSSRTLNGIWPSARP